MEALSSEIAIGDQLKQIVDHYIEESIQSSSLLQQINSGRMTREGVAFMLHNIHYAVQHTPIHLKRAAFVAKQQGAFELSEFFIEKIGEEAGHDQWAQQDLEQLLSPQPLKPSASLSLAIQNLMDYLSTIIQHNPRNYLAYIFMNEYMAARLFGDIVQKLEENCGIPRTMLTVLDFHHQLDQEHILDDLKALDSLLKNQNASHYHRITTEFFATLYQSLDLMGTLYNELGHSA